MNDDIFPVPEKAPNTQDRTIYQMDAGPFTVFNNALEKWQEIAGQLKNNDPGSYKAVITQKNRTILGLPEGPPDGLDIEYKDLFTKIIKAVAFVDKVVKAKENKTDFDPKALPGEDKCYGIALHFALSNLQAEAKKLQKIWTEKLSPAKRQEVEENIPVKILTRMIK